MTDGKITLPSGRIVDPNVGYIGINHLGSLSSGYDQVLLDSDASDNWLPEDRRALAKAMIARWQKFADASPVRNAAGEMWEPNS